MIEKVQIKAFRGILEQEIEMNDITVFEGEMGTGKTSKLLAILFGLTGEAPSGLTLDDLIHVSSDSMKVTLNGRSGEQPFTITRTKNRGSPTHTKVEGEPPRGLNGKLLIEGREIAQLFTSSPSEVARKVDSLLGFQTLSQLLNEISTYHVERRISRIQEALERAESAWQASTSIKDAEAELNRLIAQGEQLEKEIESMSTAFRDAEALLSEARSIKALMQDLESKQSVLKSYREQLSKLPSVLGNPEEELSELRGRYMGMQRRISFLEAAMQTLDFGQKSMLQLKFCPLCGSPVSPTVLENFKHYEEEYKGYIARSQELEALINDAERRASEKKAYRERSEYLKQLIADLEQEVKSYKIPEIDDTKVEEAQKILQMKSDLESKLREVKIGIEAARRLVESLANVRAEDISRMQKNLAGLMKMKSDLVTVKEKALDVLKKERLRQLGILRDSFEESFRRIYPYGRFKSVTFDVAETRGREALTVKAKLDGGWLRASQMSTGENVAMSFALLYVINDLEKSPIILLDEPEEGLDRNGVEGLAHVLRRLRDTTQIVVATRDSRFAELLRAPLRGQ